MNRQILDHAAGWHWMRRFMLIFFSAGALADIDLAEALFMLLNNVSQQER